MIEHIDKLIEAGVTTFKIEGRVKSEYYVATVVKAYRDAIDNYLEGKPFNSAHLEELKKISHRDYTTGFYFGKPAPNAQVYTTNSYIRNYELIGVVTGYDKETKTVEVEQRNRFFKGDEVEILLPGNDFITLSVTSLKDDEGNEIDVAPHPTRRVTFPCETEVPEGSFVRKVKLL